MADQIENPTPEVEPQITPPGAPESDAAEQSDWDSAADDLLKSNNVKPPKEDASDEPAKPKEGEQKAAAPEKKPEGKEQLEDPAKQAEGDGDEKEKAGDDEGKRGIDRAALDSRLAARQAAQQLAETKVQVRRQMFADRPTELKDSDGDPIRTAEDLMKLNNPNTGKAFTKEEAEAMLPRMQAALEKQITETNRSVEQIAELQVQIKDEADLITDEYGPLLEYPEIRDKIFNDFKETLEIDEKTGLILKMPVSLQKFYRNALEPYAELGRRLEAEADKGGEQVENKEPGKEAAPAAKTPPADKTPSAPSQADRAKERADRSDIYGGGKADNNADPEDKEWDEAATAVFGPRSNYERK